MTHLESGLNPAEGGESSSKLNPHVVFAVSAIVQRVIFQVAKSRFPSLSFPDLEAQLPDADIEAALDKIFSTTRGDAKMAIIEALATIHSEGQMVAQSKVPAPSIIELPNPMLEFSFSQAAKKFLKQRNITTLDKLKLCLRNRWSFPTGEHIDSVMLELCTTLSSSGEQFPYLIDRETLLALPVDKIAPDIRCLNACLAALRGKSGDQRDTIGNLLSIPWSEMQRVKNFPPKSQALLLETLAAFQISFSEGTAPVVLQDPVDDFAI